MFFDLNTEFLFDYIRQLFTYSPDSPLTIGSIPFGLIFMVFLLVYVLLKHFSRYAMMLYVVAFDVFFAYKANGGMAIILPATAVLNYTFIDYMRRETDDRRRRKYLLGAIVANLLVLSYFKYTNFVVGDFINEMFSTNFSLMSIALPIGISFYTLQAISFAVDVYKRKYTEEVALLDYLFYLTFFPLLLAGPITRGQYILPQLKENKQATDKMVWTGLWLIMLGLIKKNILGDYLAQYNNWVFDTPASFSGYEGLMALLGYPAQIFLDFSGYSDMSIGIASIMGFTLPHNFFFPYRSLNLTEFWRRWHISLSTWYRDYVYIPLGGNRKGNLRMYANNFVTMLVAGLWHGASWMFLIWGALHGIGLVVHKFFSRQLHLSIPKKYNWASWLLTYLYVTFAWSFFRAKDMHTLSTLYSHIAQDFSMAYFLPFVNTRTLWCVFLVGTMLSYAVPEKLYENMKNRFIALPWIAKTVLFILCVQLVLELSLLTVQPFIYSQF